MRTLNVNAPNGTYKIDIGKNIINKDLFHSFGNAVVLTDKNVNSLYGNFFNDMPHYILQPGETSKNFFNLEKILNYLLENNINRSDTLIVFGGGVVGDIGGFAAATYKRGIKFIQIPTTLLAQVDSSVGGKVAVNLENGKNMAGAFYQPQYVVIDVNLLKSLDKRLFAAGMAEVIKYAYIKDRQMLNILNEEKFQIEDIIYNCCSIKANIVEEDAFDIGLRMILNYGHTLGHAIESSAGYGTYLHGEAVAIGMVYAAYLSEIFGLAQPGLYSSTQETLIKFGLPVNAPQMIIDNAIKIIGGDKKADNGYLNLILLRDIGEAEIKAIDITEIQNKLRNIIC